LFNASWALRASPNVAFFEFIGENLLQAVSHDGVVVCKQNLHVFQGLICGVESKRCLRAFPAGRERSELAANSAARSFIPSKPIERGLKRLPAKSRGHCL